MLTLFYLNDMPVKQIARTLDVSENTVRTRLTRGRARFREAYLRKEKMCIRDRAYAASRYTEAKLEEVCNELFRDIDKDTVDFVDNVAHELRTPLTAVGGYAEYIQRAELSEEEKYEAAQYIVEEANRLAVMSERLSLIHI